MYPLKAFLEKLNLDAYFIKSIDELVSIKLSTESLASNVQDDYADTIYQIAFSVETLGSILSNLRSKISLLQDDIG